MQRSRDFLCPFTSCPAILFVRVLRVCECHVGSTCKNPIRKKRTNQSARRSFEPRALVCDGEGVTAGLMMHFDTNYVPSDLRNSFTISIMCNHCWCPRVSSLKDGVGQSAREVHGAGQTPRVHIVEGRGR